MSVLEDKLKLLPTNPGVYVMLNSENTVIYVGKAKNLKNRVRQYFFNSVKTEKVMAMVKNIADFYYIIAPSEIDALSLENNLIKKYKPRYNILLKDDKTYPYIKVDIKETFPSLKVTRKIKKDGAKYFGPFMGGINVNEVIEMVNLVFGLRTCDKKINLNKPDKPCLNFHLKRCFSPCSHQITIEEYKKHVDDALAFLSGETYETEKLLKEKMLEASEIEEFELALKYKNAIDSLEKIKLKRITSLNKFLDADILAYASNGLYSVINLLVVRKGRMLGGRNFSFESGAFDSADAISEFILSYYKNDVELPDEIVCDTDLDDESIINEYFRKTFSKCVSIINAKQGVRKQLVDMAIVNAEEHLAIAVDRIKHKNDMTHNACVRIKEILGLTNYPHRAECYDISNISGVDKVGSMVVFTDGEADRTEYRRFKIKTFEGADDYRSHQEMMRRRLDRLVSDAEKFPKPDLMIIDGGKGQLNSVLEVFKEKNITGIDLIALAEQNEEVFVVGKSESIKIDKHDYALKMLIRIRDEAHRFAITYFRSLHGRNSLSSVLDEIKGIGKVKKKLLLEKFKDLGGIISAQMDELKSVEGIGDKDAQSIIDKLTKEGLR